MEFMQLIFKDKWKIFILIVLLGLLTGGIHVGLFIELNRIIAGLVKTGKTEIWNFLIAFILLVTYMALNRILSKRMIYFSQGVIHDFRIRLMRSVTKLSYEKMIPQKEILSSAITKDTVALSQAALSSVYLITSTVTVAGCLVYLGFISFKMLSIVFAVILLGVCIYLPNLSKSNINLKHAREYEDHLFHHVNEVIEGFREIKINPGKGHEIIEGPLLASSNDTYKYSSRGLSGYFSHSLTGQFLFYMILLVLLFSGNVWFNMQIPILISCVFIILYLAGPLESIVVLLPSLGTGNIAAARLNNLLISTENKKTSSSAVAVSVFEELRFQGVRFTYGLEKHGVKSRFYLGPIDFVIKKGDVIFIYGGNGSGKTTFFHLMLGLLIAEHGDILLNNKKLSKEESVNSLFAPVFSDFYLFDKLYGLSGIDMEKVVYYLNLFEMNEKVKFEHDRFSTLDLSTGQRKRLALISVLLENRPVLFLDEWAADQDPLFREKFYNMIIPSLKKEGFTILAITHDDKYYHTSDALYKMEMGQLFQIK